MRSLVNRVGHTYGRRTMQGLLRSRGVRVSQAKVAASLDRVAPIAHSLRQQATNRLLIPPPYYAQYFGDKLHLDQNEKCIVFGVTHVVAVDAYSRKIVGFITIPQKNAIAIYDLLFRPLLFSEGLWEQVRVDHGTEFSLVVTAQQFLSPHRTNHTHHPVWQSLSRQNHRAQRIWPEVNQRINYPIKRALMHLEKNEDLKMGDYVTKFCVSWVTIRVMKNAIHDFVQAWNFHHIPGSAGGVPSALARNSRVTRLPQSSIPSTLHMLQFHERDGSHLRRLSSFGTDPLLRHPQLQELRN